MLTNIHFLIFGVIDCMNQINDDFHSKDNHQNHYLLTTITNQTLTIFTQKKIEQEYTNRHIH